MNHEELDAHTALLEDIRNAARTPVDGVLANRAG
jgi:hypothetical protein